MNIFDILKDIITLKTGRLHEHPDFENEFNRFIIIRYLSMDVRFEKTAFELNDYTLQKYISDKDLYLIMIKKIPKCKNNFIRYIKKPKSDVTAT